MLNNQCLKVKKLSFRVIKGFFGLEDRDLKDRDEKIKTEIEELFL